MNQTETISGRPGTMDIFEDLRIKLITAHFEPGEKLKSADLCVGYGCSANTVREALFRLSTIGLVTFADQRGFRVRAISRQLQHDLTELRILLEQEGAVSSITKGGIEWEARLTAAHHKLSHIESQISKSGAVGPVLIPWCQAEWEFHETLVASNVSEVFHLTYRTIYDQFRQQLVTQVRNYGYFEGNIQEHKQIVDAALDGDIERTKQCIHAHLSRNLIG